MKDRASGTTAAAEMVTRLLAARVAGGTGDWTGRMGVVPFSGANAEFRDEPSAFGSAAIASTLLKVLLTTWPKTVNPPFWLSRFALLSARLKNHSLVALLGSPPSLAIAIVPRRFERVALNSLGTLPKVAICVPVGV